MGLTPPHREWFQSNVPSYQLGKRVFGFRQSITDMCRGRHDHFADCHQSRAVTQGSDPSVDFHWQPPRKMAYTCKLTGTLIGHLWRLKNSCVSNISKPVHCEFMDFYGNCFTPINRSLQYVWGWRQEEAGFPVC